MAPPETKPKKAPQPPKGKRSRNVKKGLQGPVRKSARLERTSVSEPAIQSSLRPAPSERNTPSKKVPQSSPILPIDINAPKLTRNSNSNPRSKKAEQPGSQHRPESTRTLDPKYKHSYKDSASQVQDEPLEKRARTSPPNLAAEGKREISPIDSENDFPIEYWRKTGHWPKRLFQMEPETNQPLIGNRALSSVSHAESVKKDINPPAQSPGYQKQVLEPAGIMIGLQYGESTLSKDSEQLCITLLNANYEHSLLDGEFFAKLLILVSHRNEARIVRDITPYIIPSAELLCLCGNSGLQHLTEEIKVEWTRCESLAGPRSKPDLSVGFGLSAFADNEIQILKNYHSMHKLPAFFTELMLFPFLVCEVKCGEAGLLIADRQNARSASTAVNAIIQLYRVISRAEELHRKILVFSISHDNNVVHIYGHYALVKGDKLTFHRHLVQHFMISLNKWTAYNFIRKTYDDFAPVILKMIRHAIAHLPDPQSGSHMSLVNSKNNLRVFDSQRTATAPSYQAAGFKRRRLLPSVRQLHQEAGGSQNFPQQQLASSTNEMALQREIDQVKEQLDQVKEQIPQQLAQQLPQQLAQQLPQQIAQQFAQEFAQQTELLGQQLLRERETGNQQRMDFMNLLEQLREQINERKNGKA